ncbi:MAG: alpha/beta fold hydrolase [Deltaproteobacteria bacterium]|nr:alpha/beta fold hydrolase [Deltaproteobacteria bacterium]
MREHTGLPLKAAEFAPDGPTRGNVVFLHGLGSTYMDMLSLAEDMRFPARHVLLDGPLTVTMGEHYEGRGWFNRRGPTLEGLEESVQRVRDTLNALEVDADRTVMVGFSQGAAMALATVLESDTTPAGLCMLAGFVPAPIRLRERRERVQNLYCLLCHGIHDDVVPFKDGHAALDLLASHGARARLVAFPTSHWVAGEMVVELQRFLDERLPPLK